jgi:hypothetical protein
MQVPHGESRYMDAALRHLLALGQGERIDPDTGCMHKAQAAWNLLASLELELRKTSTVTVGEAIRSELDHAIANTNLLIKKMVGQAS